LIGQLYVILCQESRVVVATDRNVRIFKASIFATGLPTEELSVGARNEVSVALDPRKIGRSKLYILGEEMWVFGADESAADTLARRTEHPLLSAEAPEQLQRRDEVLRSNRAVVRKRQLMACGVVLVLLAAIGGFIFQETRPDALSVSEQAREQYCSGIGGLSAYTSELSNVIVFGGTGLRFQGSGPGHVTYGLDKGRFSDIVLRDGQLNADVVVCVTDTPVFSPDCQEGADPKTYAGSAYDVSSGLQLADANVQAPASDCERETELFGAFLCEVAGCPVGRPVN